MSATTVYDLALAGHYTKDTLVYPHSTRTVDGGACFFGANIRPNGIACSGCDPPGPRGLGHSRKIGTFGRRKPDPTIFLAATNEARINPERSAYGSTTMIEKPDSTLQEQVDPLLKPDVEMMRVIHIHCIQE